MNTNRIRNQLQSILKPFARALALAAGLAVGSVQALTTTATFNLGTIDNGTTIPGQTVLSPAWIAAGTLPVGSILRSVSINARLDTDSDEETFADELFVYFDPGAPPSGGAILQVGGFKALGSPTTMVPWADGDSSAIGTTCVDTKNAPADFPATIDLHDVGVFIGNNGFASASWSGTITVEYDVFVPAAITSFGPGAVIGELVGNAATISWTVLGGTDVTALSPTFTLSSGTCDKVSGGTYDFTNPVVYTVTDGVIVNTYTVTVTAAAILLLSDNFENRQENGSLSTGANEAASGWKNVSGLTDLAGVTPEGGANWWDRTSPPATAAGAGSTRIRYNSGQITTDNPMPLLTLNTPSVTIHFDYAADEGDYNSGLYFAKDATSPLVLLRVLNGNMGGSQNVWQLDQSVTIEDGDEGLEGTGMVVFTDTSRFVFKFHSGTSLGNGNDTWFDNIEITHEGVADTTPPTPNPMTWAMVPTAISESSITMTATTAVDDLNAVQYYFTEISGNPGGADSGWQDSPTYTNTGLSPNTTYTYTVTARDTSELKNENAPSGNSSATTAAADTNPPPTPSFSSPPVAVGFSKITMTASPVADPEGNGVQYFFTETSGNPGGSNSGWQDGTAFTDTGLQPGTTYTYTVMARDKSLAQNESAPSAAANATTNLPSPGDVLWGGAQNITGPLDVATQGTLVYSRTGIGSEGDVTVNGVTFSQGLILNEGGIAATFPPTGDAAMDTLLESISYSGTSFVIPDLVPGDEYLLQVFLADTRVSREMILGDGNGNTVSLLSSPGQQVTATFTADSTSKTVTVNAVAGNTHLNAIQVRRLTEDSDVRITSFSSVGGDLWEVALQGAPGTGYEFRSSPNLDFNPGTVVENLTQGDPGDPGTIGGAGNSLLVTDVNGQGVVRVSLTGPRNFIRAQTPAP